MLIFKFSSNNKCFFSRWLGQLQSANAMPLLFSICKLTVQIYCNYANKSRFTG